MTSRTGLGMQTKSSQGDPGSLTHLNATAWSGWVTETLPDITLPPGTARFCFSPAWADPRGSRLQLLAPRIQAAEGS